MKKLFTLFLALSIHIFTIAIGKPEIKPGESYPLLDHLKTVNSLWSQVNTENAAYAEPTHFETDADRIEAHLLQVIQLLRTKTPGEIDANGLDRRADLLNTLEKYARAKDFPINTGHAYRIPYFIDYKNTPCAVGHLIIESGYASFAEKVKAELNNAYLLDMPYDEIPVWAKAHGFTVEELALIQPGYPPTNNWLPLQDGVNGEVRVLLEWEEENALVLAGTFTNASGVECTNVALWNGSGYEALGEGIEGNIVTGAVLDGEIYLGGSLGPNADLAHWTGEAWELTGVFAGSGPPEITELYVNNDVLYAAGAAIGFAGTSYGVSRLDISGWVIMPGDFNGPINSMTNYNEQLVIGGAFTGYNFTDPVVPYIATWNGSDWDALGADTLGPVLTLAVFQDKLVAGGLLAPGDPTPIGIIYLDENDWVSVYSNPEATSDHMIKDLKVIDNKLLVCGRYDVNYVVGVMGNNAGFLYGLDEGSLPVPLILNDGPVNAAVRWGDDLYLGGGFTLNYVNPEVELNHIMYYSLPLGTIDEKEDQVQIYPNPSTSHVRIDAGKEIVQTIAVFDMRGALVSQHTALNTESSYDLSALQAGTYVMEIKFVGSGDLIRKKLVVQ